MLNAPDPKVAILLFYYFFINLLTNGLLLLVAVIPESNRSKPSKPPNLQSGSSSRNFQISGSSSRLIGSPINLINQWFYLKSVVQRSYTSILTLLN